MRRCGAEKPPDAGLTPAVIDPARKDQNNSDIHNGFLFVYAIMNMFELTPARLQHLLPHRLPGFDFWEIMTV